MTADARWPAAALREERHFDGRVLRCYAQRPLHLQHMIESATAGRLSQCALIDGERRLSWQELIDRSTRLAAGLHARGLRAGDRAVMLMANRAEFVVALLALVRLGAVAVPVSVREAAPAISYILMQCGARAVLADRSLLARVEPTGEGHAARLQACMDEEGEAGPPPTGWLTSEDLMHGAPGTAAHQAQEEDCAVILYTSGTTGRPKGAMLTHLNLLHSVLHYRHVLGLDHRDKALLAVPASHVTGLVAIVLAMAGVGGCTVILREFKAGACLEQVQRHGVTYSLMVPAMYALCLREPGLSRFDLRSWRLAGFGGAPMPTATIEGLRQHCPDIRLFNAYGATETTSPTTLTPPDSSRVDKVGVALPCAQVRVVDDEGQDLPAGESGEIWIAGPMVVPGYWNNPQASADSFAGGYWKSGDIGTLDAEGFLQVHDRKKDMINRGGYKVFSIEVENCLMAHPAVLEAATVGVPCPVLGERTHAFIYAPDADPAALEPSLRSWCGQHLADYKTPDAWTWLREPLPRNANGKVLKASLRQHLQAGR